MAQAALALGVSKDLLRALKKEGAKGFRYGRVYVDDLKPYLDARKDKDEYQSKEKLECRRILAQAERIEHRLAIERGEHVPKQILAEHLQRFGAEVKQLLRQKESEFPALVANLTTEQIKPLFVLHITDDILQKFSAHFDTWTI